jgi:phytoene dehydrogenase-like protein
MSSMLSDGSVQSNGSAPSDPSVRTNGTDGSDRFRLAEAAVFLGVSVTAVKRYIAGGRLSYLQERGPTGHKLHLIPRSDLLRLRDQEGSGPTEPTSRSEPIRRTEPTEPTAPTCWSDRTDPALGHDLRSVDSALTKSVERERDRLAEDVQHLREQLSVRAEELRRRDAAEEQLRHLMAALSQQNRVLTELLEQKSLPPAPDLEPVRRVRWWRLWRRG